jgi:hypothetical protein
VVKWINSKKWQVPMRLVWVVITHFSNTSGAVLLGLVRPTILQQYNQQLYTRVNVWRKPKNCTRIVSKVVGALICKCFYSKRFGKARKIWKTFLRIWLYPTCSRISYKASFNASITPVSSDSIAVLTIGIIIKIFLFFYYIRNILKLYTIELKYNAILFDQKLPSKKLLISPMTTKRKSDFVEPIMIS